MTRATAINLRPSQLGISALKCDRCGLITLTDEISRWQVLVRRTSRGRGLYQVRLRNEVRFPQGCFGIREIAVQNFGPVGDTETAVRLRAKELGWSLVF